MSDSIIERLRKHYTGRVRKEVSNPCITAREAIEIANHISALEQPCNCELVVSLQEEIAALRKTIAEAVPTLDQFVSEVAHAQASGSSWYTRGAAGLYGHIAMWRGKAAVALAALREAGYLKEEG